MDSQADQERLIVAKRSKSPSPSPSPTLSPASQPKPTGASPQDQQFSLAGDAKQNKKRKPKGGGKGNPPGQDDTLKSVASVSVQPANPWNGKTNLQIARPNQKAASKPKKDLVRKELRFAGKDAFEKYLEEGKTIQMKQYYFCNGVMECNDFELFLNDRKRYPVFLNNMQGDLFKDFKYIQGEIESFKPIVVTQECNRYSIYKGGVFYIVNLKGAKEIPPPSK